MNWPALIRRAPAARRRAGMLAAACLVVLCTACGVIGTSDPGSKSDVLRIAVRQPLTLDPVLLRDSAGILAARQIFEPLLRFDPTSLELKPALAERWSVGDGGKRFVFHIRSNATFHNGRPIGAEDVRFSLNRLAQEATNAEVAFLLDSVAGFQAVNVTGETNDLAGVRVLDEKTIEIELTEPWYEFAYVMTHPSTAPVPMAEFEADPAAFKEFPVGGGPYRMKTPARRGQDFTLTRFEGFRGPAPDVGSIQFLIYEQGDSAWKDFEGGLLDVGEAPPGRIDSAEARYGRRGFSPLAAGLYLGFNRTTMPDIRVRQAISLGIDRAGIAKGIYDSILVPGGGLVPVGLRDGLGGGGCAGVCRLDPQRAKALLQQGYPNGAVVPPVTFDYQAGGPQEQLAQAIKKDLSAIGLTVTPQSKDLPSFYKTLDERGHQMFRLGWVADYPVTDWFLSPLFKSDSKHNYTGIADPQVDQMIREARAEPNRNRRQALYRQLESKLASEVAMVPLGSFRNHYAARSRIENFYVDRLGGFDVNRFTLK